jgi:hypothetical protein
LIGSPFDVTRFLIQLLSRSASSKKNQQMFSKQRTAYSVFLLKRQNKTADMIMLAMEKSVASIQMLQETFPLVQSLEGTFIVVQRCLPWPSEERDPLLTVALQFQKILALCTNLAFKIVISVFQDISSCSPDTVLSSAFCDKNLPTGILDHRHCNPCLLPSNQKKVLSLSIYVIPNNFIQMT